MRMTPVAATDNVLIPGLGPLRVMATDARTLKFVTAARNEHPLVHGKDGVEPSVVAPTVVLNGVGYEIEVTAYSAAWLNDLGNNRAFSIYWTDNQSWGIRTCDVIGIRRDVHRTGDGLTTSARDKALGHAVRFLNVWIWTPEAAAVIDGGAQVARNQGIESAKKSIAWHRKALVAEEKRLAGLLGYHINDLIDLRRSFEDGTDLPTED